MPLEKVEDVLSVLGYKPEDIADGETLKKRIESDWVPRNNVPSDVKNDITKGMAAGVLRGVRDLVKSHDITIENSEIEGKVIEDIVKLAFNRREDKYKSEIESLKEQVGQPNEALSKLQKEKEKLELKLQAESEKANKLVGEFETYKEQTAKAQKEEKLNFLVTKTNAEKVKFKEKISDLEKEGYWRIIDKKYNLDLDENGNILVTNKSGQPLPGKAANSYKTYEEVLEEEGVNNNVWIINPHAKNQNPVIVTPKIEEQINPLNVNRQRVIAKRIS